MRNQATLPQLTEHGQAAARSRRLMAAACLSRLFPGAGHTAYPMVMFAA